eukprot:2562979-Pyramimonas_sp.AAC.1
MNYVEWKKGKNGKKDEFFTDGALVTHAIVGQAMCKHRIQLKAGYSLRRCIPNSLTRTHK